MRIVDLPTPSAVVDLDKVESNTRWMSKRAHQLGVRLRPHVKTHKSIEAAKLQVEGHFGGITVSTLAEANHFAEGGFEDITWAFPLPVSRVAEACELSARIRVFTVVVDHPDTVDALEDEAERRAWATVNKESGGGNKSGSGRGKEDSNESSRKGGKKSH